MTIFIFSCLLLLFNSLMFILTFIALHVLSKTSPFREDESNYVNKVEGKDGNFRFKLPFQICKCKDTQDKVMEENVSLMTCSDIQKYQSRSDKDLNVASYYTFDRYMDIGFLSAEESQETTMEIMDEEKTEDDEVLSELNMMQLKIKFCKEKKLNSVCSEINSVGEREDGLEFSDFDSYTETSSDDYLVRDLNNDSDLVSSSSDGFFSDCDHDTDIRETLENNRNKLAEKHELFLERTEEEENDDDKHVETKKHICQAEKNIKREIYSSEITLKVAIQSYERETKQRQIQFEEPSKNEGVSFVKNGSARLDNSGEANSEPKSLTLERDEVGKTEDSSNSVYVSYEQQHTIDNHAIQQKIPKVDEEKSKETFNLDLNEDKFDEIWDHQDLIMQLQMELKKVSAIGLPTIFEESESPKAIEDSKSFKIDEKQFHEDPMDDLHKLYECYKEGMKKFDILNYQKMYTTSKLSSFSSFDLHLPISLHYNQFISGFLQLRDPLQLNKTQKPVFSTIMSHLSQTFLPFNKKKSNCDPSEKYIKDLRCDLEKVYVGQLCLSWEFLRWQYEKLHKLIDYDSFISHQYNNVAAEFQQFIVTLQRFVDSEIFQGPRLANYVKQRSLLRNLLQLPLVKEDCLKDKMEGKEKDVTTREKLEEIMEEAMIIFWEFVKAEKDESPRFFKGLVENHVELEDPSDYEFMVYIQASLKKKEKKLKNLVKASNFVVKMLKRREESRSNQDIFFTQVDLKIVSRVLRMSRITSNQLIWCQKKLSKITFSGRKIHRESTSLLFPC